MTSQSHGDSNQPSMVDGCVGDGAHAGVANASTTTSPPSPSPWRQRTPRSPGARASRAAADGASARSASRRHVRLRSDSSVTAQWAPPTTTRIAVLFEPKPEPATVRSVPPAAEPERGATEAMRGSTSASKVAPPATSSCFDVACAA